jgi:hypothetical protein
MPFKSEAQRRKFQQLHAEGKISKSVLDAFENETKGATLPDKVKPKEKPKKTPRNKAWTAKVIK